MKTVSNTHEGHESKNSLDIHLWNEIRLWVHWCFYFGCRTFVTERNNLIVCIITKKARIAFLRQLNFRVNRNAGSMFSAVFATVLC